MNLLAFDPLLPLKNLMGAILAYIYAGFEALLGVGRLYYGPTIIVFTLLVMLALAPLTIKSTRSMIKTQRLAPKLKKLQEEYKDDRQALNEATMAMYKDEGINPLGGCLPLLLQMPFFFGLFALINGLTHINAPKAGTPGAASPLYISPGTSLFRSIVEHNAGDHIARVKLPSFGLDLGISAWDAVRGSTFTAFLPYVVLVILTVLLQYYQQHQITQRNPQSASSGDAMAQQMQMMTKVMPLMFGIFSFTFSTGLVLYLVTSSVFRIVQQWAMYKFDPELRDSVLKAKEAHAMEVGEKVAKDEHRMTARERAEARMSGDRKGGGALGTLLGASAGRGRTEDSDEVTDPGGSAVGSATARDAAPTKGKQTKQSGGTGKGDRAARVAASRKTSGAIVGSTTEGGTNSPDARSNGNADRTDTTPATPVKGGGGKNSSQAGRSARPRRQQPNKGRKGH